MLEKCLLTVLELIWNQRLGHKTKLNICHHMLTSSTQLQNRSFHVVERTRTSTKCQKMKSARAKRAKILFFTVKYANLWGFCCRRCRGCLSSLLYLSGRMMNVQKCVSLIFLSHTANQFCDLKHCRPFRWHCWTPDQKPLLIVIGRLFQPLFSANSRCDKNSIRDVD